MKGSRDIIQLATRVLKLAVIALLAAWLYRFAQAGISLQWGLNLLWAGLAGIPITFLGVLLLSERWRLLLSDSRVTRTDAARGVLLVLGLNPLIPLRGSELLKLVELRARKGVGLQSGLAAMIVERLIDVIFFAAISAGAFAAFHTQASSSLIVCAAVAAAFALLGLPLIDRPLRKLLSKVPFGRRLSDQVSAITFRLRERRKLLHATILTLMVWTASAMRVVVFFAVLNVFGAGLTWQESVLVFAVTTIGGVVAVLPAGFGTYEAAAVMVMTRAGLDFSTALPAAVVLHVAQLLPLTLAAIYIAATSELGLAGLFERLSRLRRDTSKPELE